jgi:uncharacterized membrane protein YqiK
MVNTMQNLVNEVHQSAVGNSFRNKLQTLGATEFIDKRDEVQHAAESYIQQYLSRYEVETEGLHPRRHPPGRPRARADQPGDRRPGAGHLRQQREAQVARVSLEQQRGVADMQGQLAQAKVSVDIDKSRAEAASARAEGEAAVITTTGTAEATRVRAIGEATADAEEALGVARAKGFDAQRRAIGAEKTALVAALHEVGSGRREDRAGRAGRQRRRCPRRPWCDAHAVAGGRTPRDRDP